MQDGRFSNTDFENKLNNSNFGKALVSQQNIAPTEADLSVDQLTNIISQKGRSIGAASVSPYAPTELRSDVIDNSGRYPLQLPGEDNEDLYAQSQTTLEKARNGVLKALELAGSTFLQGTAGLVYGLEQATLGGGGLNAFFDNDLSNTLQKWNEQFENYIPNYYSKKERDAKWYEPGNIFTANFIFDKLIKNAGFSLGALAAGGAISAGIKATLGAIPLFANTGKVAQIADKIEEGLTSVPQSQRLNTFQNLIRQASTTTNTLSKILPSSNTERTLVSILGASTEGGIEALQGVNEWRDKTIENYKNEYGVLPTGEDLNKIDTNADNIGRSRFLFNLGLLTATNFIQLPSVLGSKYTTKRALANTEAEALGETFGITKEAGKFIAKPNKLLNNRLTYTLKPLFSLSEAFEEGSQYAIQTGVEDYYDKAYKGKGPSIVDSIGEGLRKTFSDKEGLESILLGGLSGGLQETLGSTLRRDFSPIKNAIAGTNIEKARATESLINNLNNSELKADQWLKDMSLATSRGSTLMQEEESHIKNGDVLEAKDSEADQIINYLSARIKHGRFDLVKDDINNLLHVASNPNGLDELKSQGWADENDTLESFTERVNKFQEQANNINSLYQSLNLRYSGRVDKDGNKTHPEEVIDKMVYAASKISDYDTRIPELSQSLFDNSIPIQSTIDRIVENGNISEEDTRDALNMINNLKVDGNGKTITSDYKDELKSNYRDILEMSLRRREYLKEYDSIKRNPSKYIKANITDISKGTISIPQGGEIEEVEVGQPLYSTNPIMRQDNSLILSPKVIPISQTLRGEIEIQLPNGSTTFVSPSIFKNYTLSPFSNTNEEVNREFTLSVEKVLEKPEFQSIKSQYSTIEKTPEAIQDFVNSQNDKDFIDAIVKDLSPKIQKIKEKQEAEAKVVKELNKNNKLSQELNSQQSAIDNNPPIESQDAMDKQEMEKSSFIPNAPLISFLSKEADYYDKNTPTARQKRRLSFLENLSRIFGSKKADRIRVLAVTRNNEEKYGLKGLVNYVVEETKRNLSTSPEETRNIYLDSNGNLKAEHEPIIKLYVSQSDGKFHLIGEDGTKLSTLSSGDGNTQEAIASGIFGVFHSTFGTYKFSNKAGQSSTKENENVEEANKQFQSWRERVLASKEAPVYSIDNISRGIIIRDETNKPVTSTSLVKSEELDREDLIVIPTVEKQISIGDIAYNFPLGRPILKNGSNVDFLNNRRFTMEEANNLYSLLLEATRNSDTRKRIHSFLNGLLYVRSPRGTNQGGQLYITNNTINLGSLKIPYSPISIEANKQAIIDYFSSIYQKTNNKYLNREFEEAYIENGEVKFRTIPSYQRFLLSGSNPFLQTLAIEKTGDNPGIISRYTTLKGEEFAFSTPQQEDKKEEIRKEEPKKELPKQPQEKNLIQKILNKKKKAAKNITDTPREDIPSSSPIVESSSNVENLEKAEQVPSSKIEQQKAEPKEKPTISNILAKKRKKIRGGEFKLAPEVTSYNPADVEKEIGYIKEKLPFHTETLTEIIKTPDGLYAWGQYKDMVISLYNKAQSGTGYHEAFEGVWKVFSSVKEKRQILKEFRGRKGSFVFFNGEEYFSIPYSEATDHQAKESLADEFADYILTGKNQKGAIARWFSNIWNFIKSIFDGRIYSIDNLFSKIDAGKYKSAPFNPLTTGEAEYSLAGINYRDEQETIEGVALELIQEILNPNSPDGVSLVEFDESKIPVEEAFQKVYNTLEGIFTEDIIDNGLPENQVVGLTKYWETLKDNWEDIKTLVLERLKTFSIVTSLNDDTLLDDRQYKENYSNRDYVDDDKYFENDAKNTAPRSIKLLFLTLPESIRDADFGIISKRSASTFMRQRIQYAKYFNRLLLQLAPINSFNGKLDRLKELGEIDSNFQRIYNRLNTSSNPDNPNSILNDWKLKVRWFNTFSKQVPTAYVQYNQSDGTSFTGTANLESSIKNLSQTWIDELKNSAISGTSKLARQNERGELTLYTSGISFDIGNSKGRIGFLNSLSIPFTIEQYNSLRNKEDFNKAVAGLYSAIKKKSEFSLNSPKELLSSGNLQTIAEAYISTGGAFNSTYINMEGRMRTTFISTNKISRDVNDFNETESLDELYEVSPQLRQIEDSIYINNILFNNGERTGFKLEVGYIEGTKDSNDKPIPGEKLSVADRLTQEINQNLSGRYYILVPADSKTQWLLSLKNTIPFSDIVNNSNNWEEKTLDLLTIYYNTEKNSYINRKEKGQTIGQGIFKELSDNYEATDEEIRKSFSQFIENSVNSERRFLEKYNVISNNKEKYIWNGIDGVFKESNFSKKYLNLDDINNILRFRTVNYIINNIEIQKMFFGDILEYKDATKRYKLFLSPRESSFYGVPEYNEELDREYNKGLEKNPLLGYIRFSDEIKTVTMSDVLTENENLSKINKAYSEGTSTDAQAWGTLPSLRSIRLKVGTWSEQDEEQYQYNIARDRQYMFIDGILNKSNYPVSLQIKDKEIIKKGNPNSSFIYVLKPIVSGHTFTDGTYHPIVDKFSIAFPTYATIRDTNFRDHYVKMLKQGIGYIIAKSGRKVGARTSDTFYNEDGSINNEDYSSIINIPFSTFGIQTDTSGIKEYQTRGSQISKEAIMDLYDNGSPISEESNRLSKENIELLREQTEVGYQEILKIIGAEDVNGQYRIIDKTKIVKLLTDELLRRDIAESIKDQLGVDINGNLITPFEALPNYSQIKNILYSYVDRNITHPKVGGAPLVQMSGSLMEKYGVKRRKVKGKYIYYSEGLKFYTKEEPWCEVLLPAWFAKKLRKVGISWENEEELMEMINNSPDRDSLLSGIGFRIPTQGLNSIENFKIKGFLPEEMGNTVVVPEEIVVKAGSDFDIDKLNTYLKNIYVDSKKQIRVVPYFGIGEEAKEKLKDLVRKDILEDFLMNISSPDPDSLDNINMDASEQSTKNEIDRLYKQSIENEYYDNISKLLSLPENFERLITPNTTETLVGIRNILVDISSVFGINPESKEANPDNPSSIINWKYMLDSRHNGQSVKGLVGIAANAQTGHAISQLSPIVLDFNNKANLRNYTEKLFLNNGKDEILLPHNKFNGMPTISAIKDVVGRWISDKISQYVNGTVDVFKDAFLAQINFNRKTAGVYLMLERLGVPNSIKHPIVSLFMNQPIIKDLVDLSDIEKTSTLLNTSLYKKINQSPRFKPFQKQTALPQDLDELTGLLKEMISNYYEKGELTKEQKGYQKLILDEFMKYSVYSANLFRMQQAVNYDTSRLSDNYTFKMKELATTDAETNNLWNSANSILNSTFIGSHKERVGDIMNIYSDVLLIQNPITQKYLFPYIDNISKQFVSQDEKLLQIRKLEESLLNFLVHTKTDIGNKLKPLLIDVETSILRELRIVKKQLRSSEDTNIINGNIILNQLIPYISGNSIASTKNITLAVKARDVYTKNLYNRSFTELYNNPITHDLAEKLVEASFLQNGISNSPISYKDAIPSNLYSKIVNEAINYLIDESTLQDFIKSDTFYRNNTDLLEEIYIKDNPLGQSKEFEDYISILRTNGTIPPATSTPKVAWISPKYANDDYVVHIETIEDEEFGKTYYNRRLFKKVTDNTLNPIGKRVGIYNEFGDVYEAFRYMYIQVNKWGDGWKAQEHYSTPRTSVLNNGFIKVGYEVNMNEFANYILGYTDLEQSDSKNTTVKPSGLPGLEFDENSSQCK